MPTCMQTMVAVPRARHRGGITSVSGMSPHSSATVATEMLAVAHGRWRAQRFKVLENGGAAAASQ